MTVRATLALLLAVAAAVGSVLSWLAAATTVVVAPVLEGEPQTTSVEYSAPLLGLALVLATVAGVLAVLAVAHLRRRRTSAPK
ncbi:hypothetical protein A5765_10465 [Mycolicibacterium celeriflavum]|uniref:Uncharacterized protein n=1 Tax=Mycolicibacterium celeriflavum TaxID=1249101 RepID=A0A1X0BNA0_MYCCF|nr:hypothetical protein [Mycolicibacterium celeriflavum]MCV7240263.1 hypothetical protein [Mycolicibacterium celeriflavum]OBG14714.1 hypothetical protein A5765_10465 [Mycolicibacterium celeriflavum]ORA44395.1 hypothetical protein BST21_19755 [Mycolicibacterium celeriflavum]BBY44392.1 hypothetical protein MCEL_26870 [Mycolicibacterium celeriflavum]